MQEKAGSVVCVCVVKHVKQNCPHGWVRREREAERDQREDSTTSNHQPEIQTTDLRTQRCKPDPKGRENIMEGRTVWGIYNVVVVRGCTGWVIIQHNTAFRHHPEHGWWNNGRSPVNAGQTPRSVQRTTSPPRHPTSFQPPPPSWGIQCCITRYHAVVAPGNARQPASKPRRRSST